MRIRNIENGSRHAGLMAGSAGGSGADRRGAWTRFGHGLPGLAAMLFLLLTGTGCNGIPARPSDAGRQIEVTRTLTIPAGQAHVSFQGGQATSAAGTYSPFCELEVDDVQEQSQTVAPGTWRVRAQRHEVLTDPTTRIPAFLIDHDCFDPLYQVSTWFLQGGNGADVQVRSLRCVFPYFQCRLGPAPRLDVLDAISGGRVRLVSANTMASASRCHCEVHSP